MNKNFCGEAFKSGIKSFFGSVFELGLRKMKTENGRYIGPVLFTLLTVKPENGTKTMTNLAPLRISMENLWLKYLFEFRDQTINRSLFLRSILNVFSQPSYFQFETNKQDS